MFLGLIFLNGCATTSVHNHYINPQNKVYTTASSSIKSIKWAASSNDKIFLCIYGAIKKNPKPHAGYTTISSFSGVQSRSPELSNSDKIFMASFNKDLLDINTNNPTIHINSSTITPHCDKEINNKKIMVFTNSGHMAYWIKNNKQDNDFIYNRLNPGPFRSSYVSLREINHEKYEYPISLKIETSVEKNNNDTVKGVLLYPFAIVFDVITFPFQIIMYLLPWG